MRTQRPFCSHGLDPQKMVVDPFKVSVFVSFHIFRFKCWLGLYGKWTALNTALFSTFPVSQSALQRLTLTHLWTQRNMMKCHCYLQVVNEIVLSRPPNRWHLGSCPYMMEMYYGMLLYFSHLLTYLLTVSWSPSVSVRCCCRQHYSQKCLMGQNKQ